MASLRFFTARGPTLPGQRGGSTSLAIGDRRPKGKFGLFGLSDENDLWASRAARHCRLCARRQRASIWRTNSGSSQQAAAARPVYIHHWHRPGVPSHATKKRREPLRNIPLHPTCSEILSGRVQAGFTQLRQIMQARTSRFRDTTSRLVKCRNLRRILSDLAGIGRYESRAAGRRDPAIRKLIQLTSTKRKKTKLS
jgi:hypothetical protein